MAGTIVITGANGSIAMVTIEYLLQHSPAYTLVLTVRSAAESDVYTQKLRAILSKHADAKVSMHELDLTSMSAVTAFSNKVASEIAAGTLPPIISILCNAYHWNLITPTTTTADGFEKTFQVNHIAQAAIVLRLLGSFDKKAAGRVVMFPGDGIEPGRNMFEKYPPGVPSEQDALDGFVKMGTKDASDDFLGYGFQRYANSKLMAVMWGLALDRYLKKNASLSNITVISTNPGNIPDSRALNRNTPAKLQFLGKWILRPLLPVLRYTDKLARRPSEAAPEIVGFATGELHPGASGYYIHAVPATLPTIAQDEKAQEAVWSATARWAGVKGGDTVVPV